MSTKLPKRSARPHDAAPALPTYVYIAGPMGVYGNSVEGWHKTLHRFADIADEIDQWSLPNGSRLKALLPHTNYYPRRPTMAQLEAGIAAERSALEIYLGDIQMIDKCQASVMFFDEPSHGVGAEAARLTANGAKCFIILPSGSRYYSKYIEGMLIEKWGPKTAARLVTSGICEPSLIGMTVADELARSL